MDANRRFAELAGIEIIDPYWWCDRCQSERSPIQVTYEETCVTCGSPVIWRETLITDYAAKVKNQPPDLTAGEFNRGE
jgi:Zn finger protein HypA/HybF involved in hydrogenase expression